MKTAFGGGGEGSKINQGQRETYCQSKGLEVRGLSGKRPASVNIVNKSPVHC